MVVKAPERIEAGCARPGLEPSRSPRLPGGGLAGVGRVTSFAVGDHLVTRLLPDGVTPEVVEVDGRPAALVSAVSFVALGLRMPGVPFVRFDGGHVDYRTYVRHRGRPAVWFLGAAMHSAPGMAAPRAVGHAVAPGRGRRRRRCRGLRGHRSATAASRPGWR